MANYQRLPGPWKRCADAAGGNADAGGLLEHILLRYRKEPNTFIQNAGHKWIAQSVRCWQQEVPLAPKRVRAALNKLKEHDLIIIKTAAIGASPTQVTHIRLTPKGMALIASRGQTRKSAEAVMHGILPEMARGVL